jgi:hypothetical protein
VYFYSGGTIVHIVLTEPFRFIARTTAFGTEVASRGFAMSAAYEALDSVAFNVAAKSFCPWIVSVRAVITTVKESSPEALHAKSMLEISCPDSSSILLDVPLNIQVALDMSNRSES